MTNFIAHQGSSSPLWKWMNWVVFVFIATFPFIKFDSFLYGGSSTRSVTLIGISIVLVGLFAVWVFKRESVLSIPRSYIGLALLVYFAFIVIGGIAGIDPHVSFWSVATRTTGIWYLLHLGLFLFFLVSLISDRDFHRRLILTIVASAALFSFLAFLSPEGINILFKGQYDYGFTFANSSFAAMYLFGAFVLSLYYICQAEVKKWWMYIFPFILAINPYILNRAIWSGDFSGGLIGEARSSSYVFFLSLGALFVIWLVSKMADAKKRSITAYSLFGVSLVVAVLASWSLFSHDGYLKKVYLSQATAARPLIWDMSEKVISQRPVFGWGIDTFDQVFERNYDNRLLEPDYGNEPWFDRAHNVFIDQAVESGILGLLAYLAVYMTIILSLIHVALKSQHKGDSAFASFLIVYFALHLAELQTAFDTSISYPLIIFMVASSVVLSQRTVLQNNKSKTAGLFVMNAPLKYIFGVCLVVFSCWSLFWGWIPFVRAQITNGTIRTIGDSAKRLPLYPTLLGSSVDKHLFLWRTSTDFQRGISKDPKILGNPARVADLRKEISLFEDEYRAYIEENPDHFRAHLNLADILIYQRLFDVDKLADAQSVLDKAIELVPQSPQPYWMKAVAYIYMKKFDLAREYAKKAYDLNPRIEQSADVVKYVETSIKNFPEIDLFFFRYI